MKKRYKVDVLDYMVTSNHVHLLVAAREGGEISEGLRFIHGRIGQWHNGQRSGEGAFWAGRFHSTRIQSGEHLGRCLFYIDLNMVRAGVVGHPCEWRHCSYSEFMGMRKRCRVVNLKKLLKCLGAGSVEIFREWYVKTLGEKLKARKTERDNFWSSAVAVGDSDWLGEKAGEYGLKRFRIVDADSVHYIVGK
ncbi:MAG: transposase [Victivallales bacterium]